MNLTPMIRVRLMDEVMEEMKRQDIKWGPGRDYPDINPNIDVIPFEDALDRLWNIAEHYDIPTEEDAKSHCEFHFKCGEGSWSDILIEEVCEVVFAGSETHRREELVQVMAVCAQWVEAIDRRLNSRDTTSEQS